MLGGIFLILNGVPRQFVRNYIVLEHAAFPNIYPICMAVSLIEESTMNKGCGGHGNC